MPNDSTPRSFAFLMSKSASFAPTRAKGTFMPAFALGAPHTTWNCSSPALTVQTFKRSALGWASVLRISPTTTWLNSSATGVTASTSRPAMVICATNSSVLTSGLTHSRNQASLNFIETAPRIAGHCR